MTQDNRTDFRRGFDEGIATALSILDTETALTGARNEAIKIALRSLRSSEPNGEESGGVK